MRRIVAAFALSALAAASGASAGTDTIFASGFDASRWVLGYYVGYEQGLYPIEDVDFSALTSTTSMVRPGRMPP
jgi:ABC-type nitrate/sulfonate/bicarbonate transport system substrate-binding protein